MVLVLAVLAAGAYWIYKRVVTSPPAPVEVPLTQATTNDVLTVSLVQGNGQQRQITNCEGSKCNPEAIPAQVTPTGLFDGKAWYYYDDKNILLRTEADSGGTTQLIEKTPLTAPRDIIMSPQGKYVAFWLDNIEDPKAKLTELWVYDIAQAGIRLLAEHLQTPGIHSRVRWNSTATYAWFVVDNGPQSPAVDHLELAVVAAQSPQIKTYFKQVDWSTLADVMDHGVIDLSPDGTTLVYALPQANNTTQLVVVKGENEPETSTIQGTIPYLQWLEDNSFVYGVQDDTGVTFWRSQGAASRFVARQTGQLITARSSGSGDYIAVIMQQGNKPALYSLRLKNGQLNQLVTFNRLADPTVILQVAVTQQEAKNTTDTTSDIPDDELVAFIEENLPTIAGDSQAKPTRITITDQPATAYVEYTTGKQTTERILLKVYNVVQADWVIKARYTINGAAWQKVQGGGLADPNPKRLYEWEDEVKQWILKSSF